MDIALIVSLLLTTYCLSPTEADKSDDGLVSGNNKNNTELDWIETWEAPEYIKRLGPYYKAGFDEDGVPVYVAELGRWDWLGIANLPDDRLEVFWKFFQQYIERLLRDGRSNNEQGIVMIFDWEGFKVQVSPRAVRISMTTMSHLPRAFPVLKYAFSINTNFAAERLIDVIRPFLGSLMEKVEVYGTRADQWKPKLLRKIPASQLPPKYGGSDEGYQPVPFGSKHESEPLDSTQRPVE